MGGIDYLCFAKQNIFEYDGLFTLQSLPINKFKVQYRFPRKASELILEI